MSTTETRPADYIPDGSEIKGGGGKAWHFAYGKVVRGRKNPVDNSYPEMRTTIIGRVKRIGIHAGVSKDSNRAFRQLEVDIQTKAGLEHIKCSLLGDDGTLRPGISTIGFGYSMTQIAANELIEIVAVLGSKPTKRPDGSDGGYPTYVNVSKIGTDNIATPIYRPKVDPNAPKTSAAQQWLALEPIIKALPWYKERAGNNAAATATHLSEMSTEVAKKGWPTPDEAPAEWLTLFKTVIPSAATATSIGDITDDEVGALRLALQARTAPPVQLKAWIEAHKAAPATAAATPPTVPPSGVNVSALGDDYDPFADE